MTIGIIGYGWVGKAIKDLFKDAIIYDPWAGLDKPEAFTCDYIFICVPTPATEDGALDCSIVEESIKRCKPGANIIIRSTVNPGFCDSIPLPIRYYVVMQPEYLGETTAHPLLDETKRQFLILGGDPGVRRNVIELYQHVYNANITIRQVTNYEAEVIKLSENRAIAFKVAQCQELYDACLKNGVDYYTIRDAVYGDDPRFNLWFTMVYPDNRGFSSSKCLSKDVPAWVKWAGTGLTADLLKHNDKYNNS